MELPFTVFDRLPAPLAAAARFAARQSTVVMFVAGFLFDS
jgi:hypothetical protein